MHFKSSSQALRAFMLNALNNKNIYNARSLSWTPVKKVYRYDFLILNQIYLDALLECQSERLLVHCEAEYVLTETEVSHQ